MVHLLKAKDGRNGGSVMVHDGPFNSGLLKCGIRVFSVAEHQYVVEGFCVHFMNDSRDKVVMLRPASSYQEDLVKHLLLPLCEIA